MTIADALRKLVKPVITEPIKRNKPTMVVKVQRALFGGSGDECLVYDELRHFVVHQSIPKAAFDAMKKRPGIFAFKAYFEAEFDKEKRIFIIGKLVEDKKW